MARLIVYIQSDADIRLANSNQVQIRIAMPVNCLLICLRSH